MARMPFKLRYLLKCLRNRKDLASSLAFLRRTDLHLSRARRLSYLFRIYRIPLRVTCYHTQDEILEVATAVLKAPLDEPGVIVEAGCFKGGSTAKLSLLAQLAGRELVVFDSFEGLPENDESGQVTIDGVVADFRTGRYMGALDEVKENVRRFGAIGQCRFVKGWFDETMAGFDEPVIAAFIDVDLVESTRTCLKHLYPSLQPSGSLFSQDAHLPLVAELLGSDAFWQQEMGRDKPVIEGLGSRKLVRIGK